MNKKKKKWTGTTRTVMPYRSTRIALPRGNVTSKDRCDGNQPITA